MQKIAISQGDQLRWTRNDTVRGVRNGQLVMVESVDAEGTAVLKNTSGETSTVDLSGQQYLDYALVSTTYGSQGKTADQVLVAVDRTISKEGLYVAVSRARQKLNLYTADKAQLFKRAERSSANENPSDVLTLFNLVNPNAQNEKAARTARDVRSADQSEYLVDSVGECVAVGHRAAVRRDSRIETGSEPAEGTASGLTPEYVADVRGVVAGIEEYLEAQELEGQAERVGKAAEGIIDGARQLELTAAAVTRLDGQIERKAGRLSRTSQEAAKEERKRCRQVYEQYAAKFAGTSEYERDRLVARQLMSELLSERGDQRLSNDEIRKVGRVLLQGPVAQQLKQTAGRAYVMEVLTKAQKIVEQAHQASCSRQRSQDTGMEL